MRGAHPAAGGARRRDSFACRFPERRCPVLPLRRVFACDRGRRAGDAPSGAILFFPPSGLSTKDVYAELDHPSECFAPDREGKQFAELAGRGDSPGLLAPLLGLVANDLEAPACVLYPSLLALRGLLGSEPDAVAGMSGSGSTFFLLPRSGAIADQAFHSLSSRASALGARAVRTTLLPRA